MLDRIIGTFGGESPGPLVIATAALHGNEPAGVQALQMAFQMLEAQTDLLFKGRFVGLIGNLRAYASGSRFTARDFNRIWHREHLNVVLQYPEQALSDEDLELRQLYTVIHDVIQQSSPDKILFLDLHTTSAGGGVFSIPAEEGESLDFAKALHAPVILNMFDRVDGTLLRFATRGHFSDGMPQPATLGVAYEAGQHDEIGSVGRSLSAIINTLRFAGNIGPFTLNSPEEIRLQKSFAELPRVTRLVYAHHIKAGDQFRMLPGYINFQRIHKGEHLADDALGSIVATQDGLILMPLYQAQGSDGFFLIEEVEGH